MATAKMGDAVHVRYSVMLEADEGVRCLDHDLPPRFTLGEGTVMHQVERSLLGMSPGDIKLIRIPCSVALGDEVNELSVELGREELDELGVEPFDGMELLVRRPDGETVPLPVTEVSESGVKFNSGPLFEGRDLIVAVELVGATACSPRERDGHRRRRDGHEA